MSGPILAAVDPALLCAVGLLTGLVAALMGIGGGILLTPFLNIMGVSMVTVVPTVMGTIAASSATTSLRNLRGGLLYGRLGLITAACMLPSVEAATWINRWLRGINEMAADTGLRIAFVAAILLSIYKVTHPPKPGSEVHLPIGPFIDLGDGRRASLWLIVIGASLAGLVGALLGLGGGLILVPFFVGVLGLDVKRSIATSSLVIFFSAIYASGSYAAKGAMDVLAVAWLAGGAISGSYLGTAALRLCSGGQLKSAFLALNVVALLALVLKQIQQPQAAFILLLSTCIIIAITALALAWRNRPRPETPAT